MVFILLENAFPSLKIASRLFSSCPDHKQKEITHSPRHGTLENPFPLSRKEGGGGGGGAKAMHMNNSSKLKILYIYIYIYTLA